MRIRQPTEFTWFEGAAIVLAGAVACAIPPYHMANAVRPIGFVLMAWGLSVIWWTTCRIATVIEVTDTDLIWRAPLRGGTIRLASVQSIATHWTRPWRFGRRLVRIDAADRHVFITDSGEVKAFLDALTVNHPHITITRW